MPTELSQEGTITSWISHEHANWHRDEHGYKFPTIRSGEVALYTLKTPDGNLVARLTNVLGKPAVVLSASLGDVSLSTNRAIFVGVTWSSTGINLYVNGGLAATIEP